jgi:hypothetical protein
VSSPPAQEPTEDNTLRPESLVSQQPVTLKLVTSTPSTILPTLGDRSASAPAPEQLAAPAGGNGQGTPSQVLADSGAAWGGADAAAPVPKRWGSKGAARAEVYEAAQVDPWQQIQDPTSKQFYWWNAQTNTTTVLGAPKPELPDPRQEGMEVRTSNTLEPV